MEPIWYSVGYTILAGYTLSYAIRFFVLLNCIMNYILNSEDENKFKDCKKIFAFRNAIVLEMQIILGIVAIFSIVWRKSVLMLPLLATFAVEETYQFFENSFEHPRRMLPTSLFLVQDVVIWLVLFKIYKTLASEDEQSEYEEQIQRHSWFDGQSNRRGLSFKQSNSS